MLQVNTEIMSEMTDKETTTQTTPYKVHSCIFLLSHSAWSLTSITRISENRNPHVGILWRKNFVLDRIRSEIYIYIYKWETGFHLSKHPGVAVTVAWFILPHVISPLAKLRSVICGCLGLFLLCNIIISTTLNNIKQKQIKYIEPCILLGRIMEKCF